MWTISGKNYTQISACESTTNWTGNSLATDNVTYKEGSNSLSGVLRATPNNDVYYQPGGYIDLSGTKHLRMWFLTIVGGLMETFANGGVQFFVYDGVNTGYWKILGRDTYPGGWINLVLDVSRACDSGTKPTNMAQVTRVGFRLVLTATAKNMTTTWWDNLCVCDGLKCYGDADSGAITITAAASAGTYTRSSGDFTTDGFFPGERISISGFSNAGNNGTKYISTVTTTVITVVDKAGMVDESGTGDERIRGFFGIEQVWAADNATTLGIGILRKIGGVYLSTGALEIGDSASTNLCRFQTKSSALVFENRMVSSTLYDIGVVDNGTGTTECLFGDSTGTGDTKKGIEGCLLRVESLSQTPLPTYTSTDTDITDMMLYGTTFLGFSNINLPVTQTNIETLNCNFERCAELDPDTSKMRNCNFISSQSTTTGALKIDTTSFNVRNSYFIGCSRAIRFPSGSQNTYSFYDLVFSNNTYDIRNEVATGNTVTINKVGTSDPNTHEEPNGGTTVIQGSYPLLVICKNESGYAISGVRVRIEDASTGSLISNGSTNASGEYSDTYTSTVPRSVKVIVRLKGYKPANAFSSITTSGLSVPFTMIRDPAVDLP